MANTPDSFEGGCGPSVLGVVSFLNSRPLIWGLENDPRVDLRFAVPSALGGMLVREEIRVGLLPVVDLVPERRFKIVSDACIGSDGATMTVRVFSRVPPEQVHRLHVDGDSHSSVVLSRVIWGEHFGAPLEVVPLDDALVLDECQGVMLIGDKVVTRSLEMFPYELDLGQTWKEATGLPFVFAAWAGRMEDDLDDLAEILSAARDRGVSRASEIAATQGPELGWPVERARTYLVDRLRFTLDERSREGLRLFFELAGRHGFLPAATSTVVP